MNLIKKINLIVEYGLYLLVFLLPIQTRWIMRAGELNGGGLEYGSISLYVTDVLLIFLILIFLFYQTNNLKFKILNFKLMSYWWLIAGLEMFIFISIFFAADKTLALFCYLRFLLGVGFFWLIIKANYNKFKLVISLILGIFLQAVLGIWQFIMQTSFANKWLGLAMHNAGDLGTSVVETLSGERWLRAYGGLDHPNMLGGLLAVGIVLLVYLILNNKKLNCELRIANFKIEYYIFHFLFLFFITALFFSFSRGAWIGAGVGILAMFTLAILKNDWLAQKKLLKIILLSGIFIFIATAAFSGLVKVRTSADSRLEIKSNAERVESYKTGLKIIKNHWLFGVGIGNYTRAMHDEINPDLPSYAYQPAHDVFLLIFCEIGVFGFLSFILLIIVVILNFKLEILNQSFQILNFKFQIKSWFKKDLNFNYLPIALIICLLIIMSVDHWPWSLHFGVLFFWMILGLAVRENFLSEL